MAQFEPSRVLENAIGIDNEQQYVEIGSNTYLGTKDGIRYALFPTSDNKVRLCEIPSDPPSMSLNTSKSSSWGSQLQEEIKNDTNVTPRTIKSDGKRPIVSCCTKRPNDLQRSRRRIGNSIISTPDSTSRFKNADNNIPEKYSNDIEGHPIHLEESPSLTYTTLVPKQEKIEDVAPVLQSTPNSMSGSSLSSSSTTPSPSMEASGSSSITSGDESQVSLEYPRVPNNTPTSEGESSKKIFDLQQWIPQIHSRGESFVQMDPRESHNEKERKRRLRIKIACQYMKSLLPCVCDKTDNATVFENAVHFIAFMKETVGSDYDMEFLEQNCVF
ncbi:BHLH domain-containing protein [Trichonephila inaurata madagascariensis]|uniref:BHLH domain-containing protein n=1 Tax=Trichonephila inaurata madagascariensis TaxID=2747483 RepID=A0A8X6IQJ8_9ARAC|nr:BHLH domain-containing protein [Trichonephila inaurata madagascariensis]